MRHIFPSFGFVLFSVAFCILAGILLGIFLGQDSDKTMAGVSFGLASFSIVPITVCLFGLKEINTSFLGIMDELDRDLRLEINKYVSESSGRFLGVAFFFFW